MQVAQTILQQLGGNKFIAMTGSSKFVAGDNYINMKLTRNMCKAQYLKIELNSMDLYDMTFYKVDKDLNRKVVAESKGVYCDMLQNIFTAKTGLYTTL
jgi:hypothetical protein